MTMEATLLLVLAVGFMVAFTKPAKTFFNASPRLASRVEYQMATGIDFRVGRNQTRVEWQTPAPNTEPSTRFE